MHNRAQAWKPLIGWALPAALVAVLAWLLTPVLTSAWVEWDDTDPTITLKGGHTLSVQVAWPSPYTCTIQGPILVQVETPKGMKAEVVSEDVRQFPCQTLSTQTTLTERRGGGKEVKVRVLVQAPGDFPVRVSISLDGQVVSAPEGRSNAWVEGEVEVRR
ncbi:hypothetical protein HRbin23_00993 [bacterium HR23]|nr:hypothetical protein HRbin23_00993 [bacterium HR23]